MNINPKLLLKALKVMGGNIGRINKTAEAEDFLNAITKAGATKKGEMNIADMLTPYSLEDYKLMKLFLHPDKKSGFAIKPTNTGNELVSVFSSEPKRGRNLALEGVLRGADKLDNYNVGGKLPELYSGAGFKQTAEYPFDPTQVMPHVSEYTRNLQPSYVEMALEPGVREAIDTTRGLTADELANYLKTGELPLWKKKQIQNVALASIVGLPTTAVGITKLNN